MSITVISHIYNEEYLLPFWLEHHKHTFSHGIIIDYNSTDRSLDIIREICPTWKIIQSRNAYFEAKKVDEEVMDIERDIMGTKIALNVTEFLFMKDPLILEENTCFSVQSLSALSYDSPNFPENLDDFLGGFQFVEQHIRGYRYIHSYPCGEYTCGRHSTRLVTTNIPSSKAIIIWFGYYPWNDIVIKRKIQIGTRQSDSDIRLGAGFQHQFNEEQLSKTKSDFLNISIPYTIKDIFK